MKKKIICIIGVMLIVVCAIALTGCTEEAENADGDTVVISAYDVAVQNGFVGTEAEWLASLKGADGLDGADGKDASFSITDIYNAAQENGYDGTFLEFVKEYLTTEVATDNVAATNKALMSTVTVISYFTVRQTTFFGQSTTSTASAGGAGVIYKLNKEQGNAYIITNFHVVYNASATEEGGISDDIRVFLYGGEYSQLTIAAEFVGGSAYYDIAVLRVSDSDVLKSSDARAAEIADGSVHVGQTAIAIGYPAAEGMSVTSGVVSVDSETIKVAVDGVNTYSLRVLRVDTAINSGNSGGGLYNSEGELIGIVNAKYNSTTIENIGYAIPIELAEAVARNIIDNCSSDMAVAERGVYKCLIGITSGINSSKAVYDENAGRAEIVENVVVSAITSGGLCEGVLEVGDVLVSVEFNGETYKITRSYSLSELLLDLRVGDELTINYLRETDDGDEEGSATLTMTEDCVVLYFKA